MSTSWPARRSRCHQRLDVAPPVEHGPARLHRGVVGRHQVLGRVHRHTPGPQARHLMRPRSPSRPPASRDARERTTTTQSRTRSGPPAGRSYRPGGRTPAPRRHPPHTARTRSDPSRPPAHSTAESVQPDATAASCGWSVATTSQPASAKSATSGSCPTPNPTPRRPAAEHAPLPQGLGDEEPLPHLAMEHDLAGIVAGRPHRPQPLGPGPQRRRAQRFGRAQLRAQHDRATLPGGSPRGPPPGGDPPAIRSARSSGPAPSPSRGGCSPATPARPC